MIDFDPSDLLEVVQRTVNELAESVDEPTLRAVGFAGADIFRDEAKRNAASHIQTGILHRNIIIKRVEEESDGSVRQVYIVTVRKGNYGGGDAFYARWVEKGHKFVPRNKTVSARTGRTVGWAAHRRAAELEYGTATVQAYPYMRPAYESKKHEAVDHMSTTLAELIARNRAG